MESLSMRSIPSSRHTETFSKHCIIIQENSSKLLPISFDFNNNFICIVTVVYYKSPLDFRMRENGHKFKAVNWIVRSIS